MLGRNYPAETKFLLKKQWYVTKRGFELIGGGRTGPRSQVTLAIEGVEQGIFPSRRDAVVLAIALGAAERHEVKPIKFDMRAVRSMDNFRLPRRRYEAPGSPRGYIKTFVNCDRLRELVKGHTTLQAMAEELGTSRERIRGLMTMLGLEMPDKTIASQFPHLVPLWSEKNGKVRPENVIMPATRSFWWQCPDKSYHVYKRTVYDQNAKGCPHCTLPISNHSHVFDRHPDLLVDYHPTLNDPKETPFLTNASKVWWLCSQGHATQKFVRSRIIMGRACLECHVIFFKWRSSHASTAFFEEGRFACEETSGDGTLEDVVQGVVSRIETTLKA